jgi:hypothetical protein
MKSERSINSIISVIISILVAITWPLMKITGSLVLEYAFTILLAVGGALYMYRFKTDYKFLELDEMEKNIKLETYSKVYSLILPSLFMLGMLFMKFYSDGIEGGILMIVFIVSYVAEKVTYFFVSRKYR